MQARRTVFLILGALALAAAVLNGLPWLGADVAKARRGYGGSGYKACRRPCQVKACKTTCNKARRTCVYCAKQDGRERMHSCAAATTSKAEARQCKQSIKAEVRQSAKGCKGLTRECGGCCSQNYGGSCTSSFEGTSGFGSYFRTVKHYGKTRRYAPTCGSDDGTDCGADCNRESAAAAAKCGKRGGAECLARVEELRQQCLAQRCGSTTTTLPTDLCAPLNCDQNDDLCRDFSCVVTSVGGAFAACVPQDLPRPPCDDGNACNGSETFDCTTGCRPGAGNPCGSFQSFCFEYQCTSINNLPYCSTVPRVTPQCDDGNACNGFETYDCQSGVCTQGAPVFCPPGYHCVSEANVPQCVT